MSSSASSRGVGVGQPVQEADHVALERPRPPPVEVARLAPDHDQRDLGGVRLAHELERAADDVGVEGAGQPLVRRDDHDLAARPLALLEERMLVSSLPSGAHQSAEQLGHLARVGARREDALLGPAELRRRDELHRARDLLRGLDGADPPLDVVKGRHAAGTSTPP